MLARGWLAYPVTPMHAHLPPKSGLINVTLGYPNGAIHRHRGKTAEERFNMLARGWLAYPVMPTHALLPPKSGCRRPRRAKKDRWLGFQPSVSVSLRSAVRLLVDNTTLFDTSLLACKVAQIVQFCTTHFTKLVDCDAVDKR